MNITDLFDTELLSQPLEVSSKRNKGTVIITPCETIFRAECLTEKEWAILKNTNKFIYLVNLVFNYSYNIGGSSMPLVKQEGSGICHIVGLIILIQECKLTNKKIAFEGLETPLHALLRRHINTLITALNVNYAKTKQDICNI